MPLDQDHEIAELLSRVRRIALLGASANSSRASHRVMRFLLEAGYEVIPVNPALAGSQLLGQAVVGALSDLPTPVDMLDVFRRSEHLPQIVDEAIELGIPAIWTQLDVVDHAAADRAEHAGLQVVMDRCPAIEIPRLRERGLL